MATRDSTKGAAVPEFDSIPADLIAHYVPGVGEDIRECIELAHSDAKRAADLLSQISCSDYDDQALSASTLEALARVSDRLAFVGQRFDEVDAAA